MKGRGNALYVSFLPYWTHFEMVKELTTQAGFGGLLQLLLAGAPLAWAKTLFPLLGA